MTAKDPSDVQQMPVAPVPVHFNIMQATLDASTTAIVINVSTPQGQDFFFVTPEDAEKLGEQLKIAASQGKTGLIVPQSGLAVPSA